EAEATTAQLPGTEEGAGPAPPRRRRARTLAALVTIATVGVVAALVLAFSSSDGGGERRSQATGFARFARSAFTLERPADWRVEETEGRGPPFRTTFVSPDRSAGVTVDRTPDAQVAPQSMLAETEQSLRASYSGYGRLGLKEVTVGRNQGAEVTFKTDGTEAPPRGVTYLLFVGNDAYVVTGTGPSLSAIRGITSRMVGSLAPRP
ncbi:MAG: hypothetical protein M3133_06055, partial [Actinomycetota bacterium]|nr:hypothetical protein [Actinomycetota bacterium]